MLSTIQKAEQYSKSNVQLRKKQQRTKSEALYQKQIENILFSKKSGIQKLRELNRLSLLCKDSETRQSIEVIQKIASGLYDVETLEKMSVEPARWLQKSLRQKSNRFASFSPEEQSVIEAALKAFAQTN
jgi:hypothetical protein